MNILLLALAACPTPPSETGSPGQTDTCADSCNCDGCDSADDSGTDAPPFEVCADGVDNDGDGVVDGVGCVRAWAQGSWTGAGLGKSLVVATEAASLWSTSEEDSGGYDDVFGLTPAGASTLVPSWLLPDEPRNESRQALLVVGGEPTLVATTGDKETGYSLETYAVPTPPTEGEALDASSHLGLDCQGGSAVVWSVDAWPGASGVAAVVGLTCGEALKSSSVQDRSGQLEDQADARYTYAGDPDSDELFGLGAAFLPDPGGDGVPEVVVGMLREPNSDARSPNQSAVYIFDGTLSGDLVAADADAAVVDSSTELGDGFSRAGDLDGDGYDDLIVSAGSAALLFLGPFSGTMDVADVKLTAAYSFAAQFSAIGDDQPDLAVGGYDDSIRLFTGPIERGTFDVDDADYEIPAPWANWSGRTSMVFADADADGRNDLVLGAPDYGASGADPGPGLVAVFDLTGW